MCYLVGENIAFAKLWSVLAIRLIPLFSVASIGSMPSVIPVSERVRGEQAAKHRLTCLFA